jgi:hypothetical protein
MKAELQSKAGKKNSTYSDEYVQKNWKRFIMASGEQREGDPSDSYQQERIKYWAEKYQ